MSPDYFWRCHPAELWLFYEAQKPEWFRPSLIGSERVRALKGMLARAKAKAKVSDGEDGS